ncbi:response regulator aspartate phosphatase [Bacillus sp. C1]
MNIQVITKEHIKSLLYEWYREIRMQNIERAGELKKEIEVKIQNVEEQEKNITLYYSLLNYRHAELINKNDVDVYIIESLDVPKDSLMEYYYYFFRASQATLLGHYKKAKELYGKAEILLKYAPDELEKAEFYSKYSLFCYYIHQPLLVIENASKAKDIFSKHFGHEFKIASCYNVLGLACVQIKQFEHAEIHFTSAMDILQKRNMKNDGSFILRIRHNLGFMYTEQNLSQLAIRYLSEVTKELPNHFRAIFLEARAYVKLGETKMASDLIQKGMKVCKELDQAEYEHHFIILQAINQKVTAEELEKIIVESFSFFEKEGLWKYVEEYSDILAIQFYESGNPVKASKYFYLAHKKREEEFEKGALK